MFCVCIFIVVLTHSCTVLFQCLCILGLYGAIQMLLLLLLLLMSHRHLHPCLRWILFTQFTVLCFNLHRAI